MEYEGLVISDAAKLGEARKRGDRPITAGEDEKLRQGAKSMSQNIVCGLCNDNVTTTEIDRHSTELPYCQTCSIFFIPYWNIIDGKFVLHFDFKTPHDEFTVYNTIRKATEQKQETASTGSTPIVPTDKSEPTQTALISEQDIRKTKCPSVREQIITMLEQKDIVQTAEFKNNINTSKQSIHKALNKLIKQKIVQQVEHGHYKLQKKRTKTRL